VIDVDDADGFSIECIECGVRTVRMCGGCDERVCRACIHAHVDDEHGGEIAATPEGRR